MLAPRSESDAVAARLAQAADRLRAGHAPASGEAPDPALSAQQAIDVLKSLCAELRDADLELRRARARIAELADGASGGQAPPEAA